MTVAENGSRGRSGQLALACELFSAQPTANGSDPWTYEPEKDAQLIGTLVAASPFVSSEAADVRLFFKHSINFRKMPVNDAVSPYTQDFPAVDWNDKLFTSECRFGVQQQDVWPAKPDDLDGKFIYNSALNSSTIRKDANGKICIVGIVESKLEETLASILGKYL